MVDEATSAHSNLASDRHAHWPRLWRTFLSDDELDEFNAMDKGERRKVEPTNKNPENGLSKEMKELFLQLDKRREEFELAHPEEGIVYSTYEIEARTRQTYELFDFPFDMQDVEIVMRLDSHRGDPLKRHIVPLCHDKAFSARRVPPLTEWRVTRNLDWHVERGARGNGIGRREGAARGVHHRPPPLLLLHAALHPHPLPHDFLVLHVLHRQHGRRRDALQHRVLAAADHRGLQLQL